MSLDSQILEKYYGPEGLLSAGKFAKKFGFKLKDVDRVLEKTEVHQRTTSKKPEYYHIKCLPRDAEGRNDRYQMDLLDYTAGNKGLKNLNGGFRYVFVIIDCYSRFVWTYPLKTKQLKEIFPILMEHVLKNPVKNLTQDRESAWAAPRVIASMKKIGIKMWFAPKYKADTYKKNTSIVERVIRTLRLFFERYKIGRKDKAILKNHLQEVTSAYNNSWHRTLKRSPGEQFADQVSNAGEIKNPVSLQLNDTVRRKKKFGIFTKRSQAPYSKEVYKIGKRIGNKFELMKGDKVVDLAPRYELKKVSEGAFSVRRSNRGRSKMNLATEDTKLYSLPEIISEIKPTKIFQPRELNRRGVARVDYSGM